MKQLGQMKTDGERTEFVIARANSRLEDIGYLLLPEEEDAQLSDDGTLDTVVQFGSEDFRFSQEVAAEYRDENGELDLAELVSDNWDDISERLRDAWHEYGLDFEFVRPEGVYEVPFFRFLISTGGPGEEIRFYVRERRSGLELVCAEFWHLDWFCGEACFVTGHPVVTAIWDDFNESGTTDHLYTREDY